MSVKKIVRRGPWASPKPPSKGLDSALDAILVLLFFVVFWKYLLECILVILGGRQGAGHGETDPRAWRDGPLGEPLLLHIADAGDNQWIIAWILTFLTFLGTQDLLFRGLHLSGV